MYEIDLIKHLPDNLSRRDSSLFASQYINNWATKQLLKHRALLNLEDSKLESFEQLANDYKLDLYSNAYLNDLITKRLDTLISSSEYDTLYKYSKQNFKLNEELIKYRYISIEKDYKDLNSLENRFKRFNDNDKIILETINNIVTMDNANKKITLDTDDVEITGNLKVTKDVVVTGTTKTSESQLIDGHFHTHGDPAGNTSPLS